MTTTPVTSSPAAGSLSSSAAATAAQPSTAAHPATADQPATTAHPSNGPLADPAPTLGAAGLVGVLTAYALPVFTFFVVTVVLGSLRSELGASPAMLQLVVAAFGVAFAGAVVLGGRLGDNGGRRRMLRLGLVVMAVTSALCALAPTPGLLVAARIGQGLGAALIAPQALSIIQSSTHGEARARALGWFGAMAGVSTCTAFLAGGLIVSADLGGLGWRAVFWFEVLVALGALVASRWVPDSGADERLGLDGFGVVLLAVAVILLVLPLTEGRAAGWPWWTWAMLAAAIPGAVGFALWEQRVESRGGHAVVPPSILARTPMRLGLGICGLFFVGFGGFMFVFALAAQGAAGMGPLGIGLTLLPFAAAFLVASLLGTRAMAAAPAALMRRGAMTAMVGFALTALTLALTWPHFTALQLAVPLAVTGVGQGWLVVPLFGTVLAGVPSHQAGMGGGLIITTMQMSTGLGSALLGTVFFQLGGVGPAGAAPMVTAVVVASGLCVGVTLLAHRLHLHLGAAAVVSSTD